MRDGYLIADVGLATRRRIRPPDLHMRSNECGFLEHGVCETAYPHTMGCGTGRRARDLAGDGGYEVYGAPECAEGAPIGDSVQVGSMVFYHDGAGDQASVEIVETRAGDRQERGIDTILRCC